jgi:hypothetical protein
MRVQWYQIGVGLSWELRLDRATIEVEKGLIRQGRVVECEPQQLSYV